MAKYPNSTLIPILNEHDINLPASMYTAVPALLHLMEVTDKADRPLMYMQHEAVRKQKLNYRTVAVAFIGNKRLFLYKRMEPMLDYQGSWDLYAGPVLMGESRYDAAFRLCTQKTGITDIRLKELATLASQEEPEHLTVFTAIPAKGLWPDRELHPTMDLDEDELMGLMATDQSLFSPTLMRVIKAGVLFGSQTTNIK